MEEGHWEDCEWCEGTGQAWNVIYRRFRYCNACGGIGQMLIKEKKNDE